MIGEKKLKIALVCDHFLPRIGGVELHVRDLGLALRAAGHEAQVITPLPGESDIQGLKVHRVPSTLIPMAKSVWNPRVLYQLERILLQEKFDIIHAHCSVYSPLAYGSIYLGNKLKIASTLTCHSLFQTTAKTFRLLNKIFNWHDWPFVMTAVSTATAEGAARAAPHRIVTLLPNGVHTRDWEITPSRQEGLKITSVLRLNRKKRPQELIKAIPSILQRLPQNLPPHFTLIGKGPWRWRVEGLIRRLKLQNHVQLTGYLPRREIRKIFSHTDLFVLPTMKEAFGIAVLEARCAGLPVVAMNHGGTKDIIEHGHNGFLANNRKEFIDYVVRLCSNPSLRKSMAQNTGRGLEKFNWDQIIEEHLQIYQLAAQKIRQGEIRWKEL